MTVITMIDPPAEDVKRLVEAGYHVADKREVVLSFVWSRTGRGTEYVFELWEGSHE